MVKQFVEDGYCAWTKTPHSSLCWRCCSQNCLKMTRNEKLKRIFWDWGFHLAIFLGFLYLFICSLGIMGSAFQLLGGKEAGKSLSNNKLFDNPVAGLVLGILATVLVQSSSTSTSIIITMTAADLLTIKQAIYMVMGANIGTSVTNTIVAMGQLKDRAQFRAAFAGATVHDMFNFLTVLILLPLEAASGYLFHLTKAIVDSWNLTTDKSQKKDLLKKITKPLTSKIVQVDKKQIERIAKGDITTSQAKLLKYYCDTTTEKIPNCTVTTTATQNATAATTVTLATTASTSAAVPTTTRLASTLANFTNTTTATTMPVTCEHEVKVPCDYLFHGTSLSDSEVGGILLVCSLIVLCVSLLFMVKILSKILRGHIAKTVQDVVNADFPGRAKHLTGYFAMLVGAGITILVQSSSVFTSAVTPLVGMGIINLERMYPLTLGSNIGTTVTGILAGLASSKVQQAMQVAMAHLFFNISGILIWYPIPLMRHFPIRCARFLGETTYKYRWFAIVYIVLVFFLIPLLIFGLSVAGWGVLLGIGLPVVLLIVTIIVINVLQNKKPGFLPEKLQSWQFLPLWMHSLEPLDKLLKKVAKKANQGQYRPEKQQTDVPDAIAVHSDSWKSDKSTKHIIEVTTV